MQILLAVDTTLQDDKLDIKAFVSRQLLLKDKPVATEFRPVDCEVRAAELEKLGGKLPLQSVSLTLPESPKESQQPAVC